MSRSGIYEDSYGLLQKLYGKAMPPQDYASLKAGKPNAPTVARLSAILDTLTDGSDPQRAAAAAVVKRHGRLLPPAAPSR